MGQNSATAGTLILAVAASDMREKHQIRVISILAEYYKAEAEKNHTLPPPVFIPMKVGPEPVADLPPVQMDVAPLTSLLQAYQPGQENVGQPYAPPAATVPEPANPRWPRYTCPAAAMRLADEQDLITVADVCRVTGKNSNAASNALSNLVREGYLERIKRGIYRRAKQAD